MTLWSDADLETVPCDGCGIAAASRNVRRRDGLTVVSCAGCGLSYVNPRPRAGLIAALYGPDYFDGSLAASGSGGLRCEADARLDALPAPVSLLEGAMGGFESREILEIGCADGVLLGALAERGARARGIDLSPVAVAAARRRGLDVKEGTLEELQAEGAFDALIAREVIEHVLSPARFLGAAARALRPGGLLLVTTPNVECASRIPGWMGFRTSFEHLYFFSRTTLSALAGRFGLDQVTWETSRDLGCGPEGLSRTQAILNRIAWCRFALGRLGVVETARVIASKDPRRYYPWGVGHTLHVLYRRAS